MASDVIPVETGIQVFYAGWPARRSALAETGVPGVALSRRLACHGVALSRRRVEQVSVVSDM